MRFMALVPLGALLCGLMVSPLESHATSSADSQSAALVE